MSVTIKDIAKKAGVAHTTVSRALRGSPLISAEVTDRIREIARDMGYHPSVAARSLKTNRTQAMGVIVSNIADPFFSEILQGIDDVAQKNGYSMFIAAAQHNEERELSILRSMREHRVDGIIICSTPFRIREKNHLSLLETPIVVINNQAADDYAYSIYHDDLNGSRQVVRHLLELGHKRIAYLGSSHSGRTNLERLTGYQTEISDVGLSIPEGYVHEVPLADMENGLVGAKYFLSLPMPPTAIFCFNDLLAVGVLRALNQAGLTLPAACSVAGFDNIAFSAFTVPPLTTFEQPKRHIGAEGARLLLDLLKPQSGLNGDPAQRIKVLKGSLLIRGSTAPPPD